MNSSSDGPVGTPGIGDTNNGGLNERRGQSQRNNHQRAPSRARFEGKVEALKGFVYDVAGARGGLNYFHRTTKEIAEYMFRQHKEAGNFIDALDPNKLQFDDIPVPTRPADPTDFYQVEQWKFAAKSHFTKTELRESMSKQAYAMALGQCSPAVRDRLEASGQWADIKGTQDVLKLLKLIRSSLFSGATSRHNMHALQDAQDKFMSFRQGPRLSSAEYLERFKNLLDVFEHLGGDIGALLKPLQAYVIDAADPDHPTEVELRTARETAKDEYMGIRFLRRSDPARYGALLADVENQYTRGMNSYPTTLTMAYDMIVNYVTPNRSSTNPDAQGISFYQEGEPAATTRNNSTAGRGRGGRGSGRSGGRGSNGGRGDESTPKAPGESVEPAIHNDISPSVDSYLPAFLSRETAVP
jgi:uncharacterized membrane protein YgcG